MQAVRYLVVLVVLAAPWCAAATTYVLPTDAALADRAQLIAKVRVTMVSPSPASGVPATDYLVEIDRVVKGSPPGSAMVVRVPGGVRPDGYELVVWGAPAFGRDEKALLFLNPRNDGTWGVVDLMLGAFREVLGHGRRLAVRDLSGGQVLGGRPARRQTRLAAPFVEWLSDRAAGINRPADYWLPERAGSVGSSTRRYQFIKEGGRPFRWFEFDRGESVKWKFHQPGWDGNGAGKKQLREALAAWNDDPGSEILLEYSGRTGSTSGLVAPDDLNTLLFEDPNDRIEGSFDCGQGGILAVANFWRIEGQREIWKDQSYNVILEAEIITQDGSRCWYEQDPARRAAVFAHEVGHTLGLGHSCEKEGKPACNSERKDEAIMRWAVHQDGRGARLGEDDQRAADRLYGSGRGGGGGGGGGSLAAPSGLVADVEGSSTVRLSWLDNAIDETLYVVQMRTGGGTFEKIAKLAADSTEHLVSDLATGSYTFRVRAKNSEDRSPFSDEVSVSLP